MTVAAKLMQNKGIDSLIVVRGNQVLCIVTERDLVHRVLASTRNPDTLFMNEVMTAS